MAHRRYVIILATVLVAAMITVAVAGMALSVVGPWGWTELALVVVAGLALAVRLLMARK